MPYGSHRLPKAREVGGVGSLLIDVRVGVSDPRPPKSLRLDLDSSNNPVRHVGTVNREYWVLG